MLKVAAILEESIVDGPGIRSVIFFRAARGIAKAAIILICYLLREVRSILRSSWPTKFSKADSAAQRYYFKRRGSVGAGGRHFRVSEAGA